MKGASSKKSITSILLIMLLFAFCNIAFAQETYISISNGGGFTGSSTVYKLYPDGNLLKGQGLVNISFNKMASIRKCKSKKLFKRVAKLSFDEFNHPGNLHYSITYMHNGKPSTVTWGADGYSPPDDLKKLYDDLFIKIKAAKFTSVNP